MELFAHGWIKLTHYSILVLAKINENLLYWKKTVKFNDLHICSFFNITDCDQNYMQMLNHQINDKKRVGLCSLFSFFFSFKYFRPRPQYFDYFHMKLFDGFLFRDSVDWALKRPGERFKKQGVSVGPHHWMVSRGRRKADSFKNIWQYKNISEFV